MEQIPLTAQKRSILGRKVKKLRTEGLIPAHVFGHKVKTVHVQVKNTDFAKVYDATGETGIVDLAIDGQKRPVLIRNVQIHPVTDETLHIDFYQVNLTEKVKVNVPLEVIGESPAVEKKIGLLLTPVSEAEIEALPQDLPEKIEVDVAGLANVGDEVKVGDLKIDKSKIQVHTDAELVVAKIGEFVTKEMEAVEAEIEAEKAEAAAEAAPAEGAEAAPAEGEAAGGEPRPEGREKPSEETKEKAPAEEAGKPAGQKPQQFPKEEQAK